MKDYKSLCAAVMICSTIQLTSGHTHTRRQTTFWAAYMKSSTSWAKNFLTLNTTVTEVSSSNVTYQFRREQFARSGMDWCRWHHVSSQTQTDTLPCALTHSCVRPANARCVRTQHAESLSVSLPKIQKTTAASIYLRSYNATVWNDLPLNSSELKWSTHQ